MIEAPSRMEPCILETTSDEILDLVADLSARSNTLGSSMHPVSAARLADLVRMMNCYYSNLIEGHNTSLREIEQAMSGELASENERRDLQMEAKAHVKLQRSIDYLYAKGHLPDAASIQFIGELHRQFYADAPWSMLWIREHGHEIRMEPGAFRTPVTPDVQVGRHLPPSGHVVENFMKRFEECYRFTGLGTGMKILRMAAAHHRFNYIHPFLDGNGRVSRLMSHAMGLHAGIGAHGLWSISRGLARGLEHRSDYKRMMQHADTPRQGDRDGRGNLSHRALSDFTLWFLKVCLDQVDFMGRQFALDALASRMKLYVARHDLKPEAFAVLEQALHRGEVPRGDAPAITGLKIRAARDMLGSLLERGILGSNTPKGAVSLRFPLHVAEFLFPDLFQAELAA